MKAKTWIALVTIVPLTGCHAGASHSYVSQDAAVPVTLLAPPGGKPVMAKAGARVSPAQIAYTYSYTIELPATHLAMLMKRHQQACADAGPQVCQLLDSSLSLNGLQSAGSLNLRATPTWLARFRQGVDESARDAGGRVAQSTVGAEDLTRSLVDKQAEVRAQTTLRDRLQALLATRPSDVQDLLSVERELATVQGQLDAAASEYAVMREQVDMSKLTISYGTPASAQDDAWAPLAVAGQQFGAILVRSVAVMVGVFAALLPWAAALLAALAAWTGWLRRRRRNGGRPDPAPRRP